MIVLRKKLYTGGNEGNIEAAIENEDNSNVEQDKQEFLIQAGQAQQQSIRQ